jgi:hypothetical protein
MLPFPCASGPLLAGGGCQQRRPPAECHSRMNAEQCRAAAATTPARPHVREPWRDSRRLRFEPGACWALASTAAGQVLTEAMSGFAALIGDAPALTSTRTFRPTPTALVCPFRERLGATPACAAAIPKSKHFAPDLALAGLDAVRRRDPRLKIVVSAVRAGSRYRSAASFKTILQIPGPLAQPAFVPMSVMPEQRRCAVRCDL